MKRVTIEGWRGALHSFALVNQWQLLSLLRRQDLDLAFKDMPLLLERWKSTAGIFSEKQERLLSEVPTREEDGASDVTYRIYAPYDFRPAAGRLVLFATSEYKVLAPQIVKGGVPPIDRLRNDEQFSIVTPSKWSGECFARWGLTDAQIHVVPHGVAPEVFYPSATRRQTIRDRLRAPGFLFGNFSAMTDNKGIDLLLQAFSVVLQSAPDARLLLKGVDDVYASTKHFERAMSKLSDSAARQVKGKLVYTGRTVSMPEMADLYRALDAYVTPYRAEGFNLPPLEAAACGVPVICTRGGPTDEFLTPAFAKFIESEEHSDPQRLPGNVYLEPDVEHLAALMLGMIDEDTWRRAAGPAAVEHVRSRYTWDHVADQLASSVL